MLISDPVIMHLGDVILASIPPTLIAIGTLITAIRNGKKTSEVKSLVNGRMDELIRLTREAAHQSGREAGIKELVENGQVGVPIGNTPISNTPTQENNFSGFSLVHSFPNREVIIRDRETGQVLCRRLTNDSETLGALNDPTKIVE